jgi:C1A family cysteine protease
MESYIDGLTVTAALTALRVNGQPEEAAWPYIANLFTDQQKWMPPKASPIFRRKSDTHTGGVDTILSCLDADKHVLFTMSVSPAFFDPDPGGIIAASEPIDPARIHALVAVGHGHREKDKFVLVRNSWGEAWGISGYGWVCTKYLAPRLLRTATMAEEI